MIFNPEILALAKVWISPSIPELPPRKTFLLSNIKKGAFLLYLDESDVQ